MMTPKIRYHAANNTQISVQEMGKKNINTFQHGKLLLVVRIYFQASDHSQFPVFMTIRQLSITSHVTYWLITLWYLGSGRPA